MLAGDRVSFEQFLQIEGEDSEMELVHGRLVERAPATLNHERLFAWLLVLVSGYVTKRRLGLVLGSRSAVEISEFGGRLPDMLFVSAERMDIARAKAIYGPPDLVIEIRSPHDRPSDTVACEADYGSIGVREIVFIDPLRRRTLVLRKRGDQYVDNELNSGMLAFESVPGFHIDVDWLFADERPNEVDTLLDPLAE